ncbi:hypothetical protein P9112_012388 [Eukaryota sp. TZLM1-RC]
MLARDLPSNVWVDIPKAELHCHLDGSMRVETVLELASMYDVKLPVSDIESLRNYLTVPMECESLVDYLKGFAVTCSVLQTSYALKRTVYEVAEDAVNDGVNYLEIRFAPSLHTDKGLTPSGAVEAVCAGAMLAEHKLPITVRIIVCAMRHESPTLTLSIAEIAWRFRNRGVVGFDLAGPENGFPPRDHKEAYDIIRSRGLNVTVHSAEASGWESARDAVVYCGAKRLGHGVRINEDQDFVAFVSSCKITLEVCPTSNVQTKSITKLSDHPFLTYLRQGIPAVICTDNILMSGVKLSSEYKLVSDTFDVSLTELTSLVYNGFSAGFVNPLRRDVMREDALVSYLEVLHKCVVNKQVPQEEFNKVLDHLALLEGGSDAVTRFNAKFLNENKVVIDNSSFSREIINSLPKADLHCRLIGSVPLETLWKEIELLRNDKVSEERNILCQTLEDIALDQLASIHDLAEILFPARRTNRSYEKAKNISAALLSSPDQIKRGVLAIIESAIKTNVTYTELVIQPHFHQSCILKTCEDVIFAVNDAVEAALEELGKVYNSTPIINFVIASRLSSDSIQRTKQLAEAAISCKKTVSRIVAFGLFGGEITQSMLKNGYDEIIHSIHLNCLKVSISAGVKDPCSILPALNVSANRLSCCYSLHKKPALLECLSLHRNKISLELTPSFNYSEFTSDTKSFVDSVIRFYLESGVSVAICSINRLLSKTCGKTSNLTDIFCSLNLSKKELVSLIESSFRSAFIPHEIQMSSLSQLKECIDRL